MTLAMAKDAGPRRGLVVVRPSADASKAAAALAGRLAAAQAAVAGPRQRVAELEGALAVAVEASDFAEAAAIQQQLPAAREALALTEIDMRVIEEQQRSLAEAEAAEARQIAEAQRRDQARKVIEASGDEEQRIQAQIDEALDAMRTKLAGARADYQRALTAQAEILGLRRAAAQAEFDLGEVAPPPNPFGEKRPRAAGPPVVFGEVRVSSLRDHDPLIRALAEWRL